MARAFIRLAGDTGRAVALTVNRSGRGHIQYRFDGWPAGPLRSLGIHEDKRVTLPAVVTQATATLVTEYPITVGWVTTEDADAASAPVLAELLPILDRLLSGQPGIAPPDGASWQEPPQDPGGIQGHQSEAPAEKPVWAF